MTKIFESKLLKEYMKNAEAELLAAIKEKKTGAALETAIAGALRKAYLYGQTSTLEARKK